VLVCLFVYRVSVKNMTHRTMFNNSTSSHVYVLPCLVEIHRSSWCLSMSSVSPDIQKLYRCCFICFSVDSQLRVRVTDACLARDIFPHDYNCLGDNENRPVKWLAIESLVHRRFSPASDMVGHVSHSCLYF